MASMRALLIDFLLLLVILPGGAHPAKKVQEPVVENGEYVGLEAMDSLSPEEPSAKWYHENRLVLRDREAILDKTPIFFSRGEKQYSVSDGGFYTYRARFSELNGQVFVAVRLFQMDYAPLLIKNGVPIDPYAEVTTYPVTVAPGRIEFGGVAYKPTKIEKDDLLRFLPLLRSEPLEEPANEIQAHEKLLLDDRRR
jgi:hypothetical protein